MTYVFSVPPEYRESFKRFLNEINYCELKRVGDLSSEDADRLDSLFTEWYEQLKQPPDNQPLIYCKVCGLRISNPYNNRLCHRCEDKWMKGKEVDLYV
jgi:hypothetical protein